MRGTQFKLRHLVGAATLSSSLLFGFLAFASAPAGAQTAPASCPVLSLGNPNPGDNLVAGGYVISGEAFDPAAPAGSSGISRVDLFMGLRDEGGTILGTAVPGAVAGEDPRFFSVEVSIPEGLNRGETFAAYALSSVTSQETVVSFPVFVGTPPKSSGLVTPTPVPTEQTVTSTCAAGSTTAPVTTTAPAASVPMAGTSPVAATGTGCPALSLANPNPGDTLNPGGLFISGAAPDVSHVDLFLGERDQGGMFLGSAVPGSTQSGNPDAFTVEVTIPNLSKGLDFAAYAIGNNGQQTAVVFPVFVGTQNTNRISVATPTPVPTTETVTSTCAP